MGLNFWLVDNRQQQIPERMFPMVIEFSADFLQPKDTKVIQEYETKYT